MLYEIKSLDDPRVEVYSTLTEAQLRSRVETERGVFIAESPKVIRVALDAGYEPVSLLCERRHIMGDAADIVERCGDIPVYTGERELLSQLTGYTLTRGVLCAMRRPVLRSLEEVCRGARRVAVIPNFSDIEPKGVPDYESHRCVFVGRPCPEKNIERLERLWAKVRQTHPDWVLERHAQTEDMASAYQRGSILVMTSRSEGFPMSLVEAQRCGLPCVAFDCKYGPAEIIVDGETGYVIPYDDDEAFVEKLGRLMDDIALRRRMGEAASRNVERFEKEKIIEEWERFLS